MTETFADFLAGFGDTPVIAARRREYERDLATERRRAARGPRPVHRGRVTDPPAKR